jgi:ABC-type taurine transport system substrate-binding protein
LFDRLPRAGRSVSGRRSPTVNYADAQVDLALAAWQRGEVDSWTTIRALEEIRAEIKAASELKSLAWLAPLIEAWIDRLAASYGKEVAASA